MLISKISSAWFSMLLIFTRASVILRISLILRSSPTASRIWSVPSSIRSPFFECRYHLDLLCKNLFFLRWNKYNRNIIQGTGQVMNVFPVERGNKIPSQFSKYFMGEVIIYMFLSSTCDTRAALFSISGSLTIFFTSFPFLPPRRPLLQTGNRRSCPSA